MMEENEMNEKEELFSKAVRAGKRTYFFDVKTTKGDEKNKLPQLKVLI